MSLQTSTFSTLADKFLNETFSAFAKDIQIVEEVESSDGQGGLINDKILFADTVCFIFPMAGKEDLGVRGTNLGGLYTDQMFKFSMKPVDGLTSKMIIRYIDNNGTENEYRIESIEDVVEADVWLDVIAKKDLSI